MAKTRRRLAVLATGGAAVGALLLGGTGQAQAVGTGSDTITITGGKANYVWPSSGGPADIRVWDTKPDGKCAYVHVYGTRQGGGFDDTYRAGPAGHSTAVTYLHVYTLHIVLYLA
jgi:hypothetical protein